jgi:hypothetical protein
MRGTRRLELNAKMNSLYEQDFYAWCHHEAEILRELQPEGIDWVNVAEELEGMARSDKRALRSQLERLIMHLLKLQYAVSKRGGRSWGKSVLQARHEIEKLLDDSPSLRSELSGLIPKAYVTACRDAAYQMGLDGGTLFPKQCPWDVAALLDYDFWPGEVK